MEPDLDAQMNPCSRRCFVVAVFHLYVSFLLVCRALNDTCLCVSDACLPSPNIVCHVCPKYVFVCVVVVLCFSCIDVEHYLLFSLHTLPFDPCPHFLSCDWLSLQEVRNQDSLIPSFPHLNLWCLFSSPVTFVWSFPDCHSRPSYFLTVGIYVYC